MKRFSTAPLLGASIIALASLLAACGGGGGGGTNPPVTNPGGGGGNGGGGNPSPSPSSSSSPAPGNTPTPGASGNITIGSAGVANVAFTCGCNGNAGLVAADASGNYTINVPASVLPKGSSGTYTPAGHNLMVIGYSGANHAQGWSMEFFATTPAKNLNLQGTASSNTADVYTTATALYVYYKTIQYYTGNSTSDNTYDVWNFNDIIKFYNYLKSTGGNTPEKQLITDIGTAQTAGSTLYPVIPHWDNFSGATSANPTILNDITAIEKSNDTNLPVPCGTSCTGTPTP